MSSVQSFLRQRNVSTSTLAAPADNGCYYVFVPTAGNYVGNYPPGFLVQQNVVVGSGLNKQGSLIRDMGKTIKAPVSVDGLGDDLGAPGFFREVQLINPVAVLYPTSSTTFGVGVASQGAQTLPSAGNPGDAGYNTYYLPIVVDGVLADGATLPDTYLPLGGQL